MSSATSTGGASHVAITKPSYTIILGGEGEPDQSYQCNSLKAARLLMRLFIERHNFGASQLSKACGTVKDRTGGIVAHVSYNGRLWGTDGKLLSP